MIANQKKIVNAAKTENVQFPWWAKMAQEFVARSGVGVRFSDQGFTCKDETNKHKRNI